MRAEVPNPMVFTVFSTPADRSCVLAVRADRSWNVSIYVGFCTSTGESHGIYSVFACFLKANFFDEVRSYGFYSVLYTSSLLVRVVFTYVFARPAAKSMFFSLFGCLSEDNFSTRSRVGMLL